MPDAEGAAFALKLAGDQALSSGQGRSWREPRRAVLVPARGLEPCWGTSVGWRGASRQVCGLGAIAHAPSRMLAQRRTHVPCSATSQHFRRGRTAGRARDEARQPRANRRASCASRTRSC